MLKQVGRVLGNDVGRFVKHFIVSLQIYMCDPVPMVKQVAEEVFQVLVILLFYIDDYTDREERRCFKEVL